MSGASKEEIRAYLEVMEQHFLNGGDPLKLPVPENIEVLPEIAAQAARMAGHLLDYMKTGELPDMTAMPSAESQLQVAEDIDTFTDQGAEAVRKKRFGEGHG